MVEPTSAVDAHTEARIAKNITAQRKGRATLFVTASPLLLEHIDYIQVLDDAGVLVGSGTHHELVTDNSLLGMTYRGIVGRNLGEVDPLKSGSPTLGTDAL